MTVCKRTYNIQIAFLLDNPVLDLGNPACLNFHVGWNKNPKTRPIRSVHLSQAPLRRTSVRLRVMKDYGSLPFFENSGILGEKKKQMVQQFSENLVRKIPATSFLPLEREVGKLRSICSFLSFLVSCPGELLAFQHGGFNVSNECSFLQVNKWQGDCERKCCWCT